MHIVACCTFWSTAVSIIPTTTTTVLTVVACFQYESHSISNIQEKKHILSARQSASSSHHKRTQRNVRDGRTDTPAGPFTMSMLQTLLWYFQNRLRKTGLAVLPFHNNNSSASRQTDSTSTTVCCIYFGKQWALSYLFAAKRLRTPDGRWCCASRSSTQILAGCRRWPLWRACGGTSRCASTCRYSGANALLTGRKRKTTRPPHHVKHTIWYKATDCRWRSMA